MAFEDVPWLVKSSGRILGPFSMVKVAELLSSREISVLDEVSSPQKRWQTIQYHDQFREVIESLRKSNLSEKTEATWTPTGVTSNLTQTLTDVGNGDLTEEISSAGFTVTGKEIVIHNVPEQQTSNTNVIGGGRFQSQQAQNTAIQRQVEKTTRGLWVVTAVILLVVVGFIWQKRMDHSESKTSYSTLKQNVVNHVQTGQYNEALRELKSFYPDPMQAGEMAIYYGSLVIQVEGQTVVGRRVLESVIAAKRPEIKQAYTGLAVADLMDNQVDSAKENLQHALALDPNYTPAVVNMATVQLQKGNYPEAKRLAISALHMNAGQGEALLVLAEAELFLFKSNGNATELGQTSRMLRDFLAKQWDYTSEIGFYSLYFEYLKPDRTFEEKLRNYLDMDPQLTTDHRHNVFVYRGNAQWKVLGPLCEQMAEKLGESPRVATVLASCFGHEGRWDRARKYVEKATQQAPKDPLAQAWLSYVLKESGEPEQASVVLARASELNRTGEYTLPLLLQARFCAAANDNECARDLYQKIYERNLENLPAISGLAWLNASKGFHGEALKLIEKGLKISPDYIPLLQLRMKADKEGWYASN